MTQPTDLSCILKLNGLYPYSDGATRRVRDFSGHNHAPVETNFAGDDSEYVDYRMRQGCYFSAANKVFTLASDPDFDWTAQSFSIEIWAQTTVSGAARGLAIKGLLNTDGWEFNLTAGNLLQIATYQAAASQVTNSTAVAVADGVLHQYGVSRVGASARLFLDGREVTYNAVGVHVNPVDPSARDMLIFGFIGWGQRAFMWNRALSAAEWYANFNARMNGQ